MKLESLIKHLPSAKIKTKSKNELLFKYCGGNYLIARESPESYEGYLVTDLPVYPITARDYTDKQAKMVRNAFKDYTIDELHLHPRQQEAHVHIAEKFPLKRIPIELAEILAKRQKLNAQLEEAKLRRNRHK